MEQFFVGFETLAKLYGSLAEANMFFYRNHEDVDNFRNLIEQRAMVIEDTEVIFSELKSKFFDFIMRIPISCGINLARKI
jgi:hypothetical protein